MLTVTNLLGGGGRDEENNNSMNDAQDENVETVEFPTPKFVLTIFSPNVVTVGENEDNKKMMDSAWKDYMSVASMSTRNSDESSKKLKLKVKMHSLIVKMINRLIRDRIIPREAVQYLSGETFCLFQVLVAPSALPVIMRKCEHIGVGSSVGQCYATPLETAMTPVPGPVREIEMSQTAAINLTTVQEAAKKSNSIISASSKSSLQVGQDTATASTSTEPNDGDTEEEEEEEDDNHTHQTVSSVGDIDDLEGGMEEEPESSSSRTKEVDTGNAIEEGSMVGDSVMAARKAHFADAIAKARKEWLDTASRIRVEQVVEEITANAAFTMDYIAFVCCAATIAAVGLATNSVVTVLASMLVSPIMGPVLGFTFGTTIRRKSLIYTSLRNELLSLVICIIVGGFYGMIAAVSNIEENREWPSPEMISRGQVINLTSGVLIAIPSGMATALSTLGKNSSGLVGVAISLSLLPPAVNAGLCWAYGIMLHTSVVDRSPGDTTDYGSIGGISFSLTLINIVCIWIAGLFTFWLKEVSPSKKKNAFWARDIKAARRVSTTGGIPPTDIEMINKGFKAARELQLNAGHDIYQNTADFDLPARKLAAARRRTFASNATEDAFFFDTNLGLGNTVVAGGAAADALPDKDVLEDCKRMRMTMPASMLHTADQFGSLRMAGAALFDSNILKEDDDSDELRTDAGIVHEDVATQILMQDLY